MSQMASSGWFASYVNYRNAKLGFITNTKKTYAEPHLQHSQGDSVSCEGTNVFLVGQETNLRCLQLLLQQLFFTFNFSCKYL